MRQTALICTLLIALSSATTHAAATSPPGLNLRWGQCYGDGGVQFRDFACNTDAGSEQLVGSFELASDILGVTGLEIYLHLGSSGATLPEWWQLLNAGSCRVPALSVQTGMPAGAVACADWSAGTGVTGLAAYELNTQGGNHARIVIGAAVPSTGSMDLSAGLEYFAFRLAISHTKTVASACSGCLEPVVIFLSGINIVPGTNPGTLLTTGANGPDSRWVSWQRGFPTNISQGCAATGGGLFCFRPTTYFDVVPAVTPSRTSTWSNVKALYR